MAGAYLFAKGLAPTVQLPESLQDVEHCAEFIAKLDGPFVVGPEGPLDLEELGKRLADIEKLSRAYMPDAADALVRTSIALRLWSACISAAKTIAHETRSGPNTPQQRQLDMQRLDAIADDDPVFAAGLECAPAFKKRRNQPYSFDGVPASSHVRRFP